MRDRQTEGRHDEVESFFAILRACLIKINCSILQHIAAFTFQTQVTLSYNKRTNLLPKSNNRWCLCSIALPVRIVHQRPSLCNPQDHVCYQVTYYGAANVRVSECCGFPVYITEQHQKCLNLSNSCCLPTSLPIPCSQLIITAMG
jgi:hypothetical protein